MKNDTYRVCMERLYTRMSLIASDRPNRLLSLHRFLAISPVWYRIVRLWRRPVWQFHRRPSPTSRTRTSCRRISQRLSSRFLWINHWTQRMRYCDPVHQTRIQIELTKCAEPSHNGHALLLAAWCPRNADFLRAIVFGLLGFQHAFPAPFLSFLLVFTAGASIFPIIYAHLWKFRW